MKAEPLLGEAIARDPNDVEVVEALAKLDPDARPDRAEEYLSRWVALRPGDPAPLQTRMEFYRKRQLGEEALADARRLLDLNPDNPQLRRSVMNQAFAGGHFDEAEEQCRALLRPAPGDLGLRTMLAEILRARGDPSGAARELDDLLKTNPAHTPALMLRATLQDEAGHPERAVPLLREVLRLDPRRQRTAGYQLGLCLERLGRDAEAKEVMTEVRRRQDVEVFGDAIKTQPENLALQTRLAGQLLADGHHQDGLVLLQAVLAKDPRFPPAHAVLADYYEKNGPADRAAEHRRLAGR